MEQHYPIYQINRFWHVGTMKKELKQRNSHEGAGLSVSVCPLAWEKIAGCGGEYVELTKEKGQFLNFHALTEEHIEGIIQWGVQQGFITLETLYEYRFWNGDWDEEMVGLASTYEDALAEACEDEESVSEKPNQPVSTTKFQERVMGNADPVLVIQLLATVFAEDVLGIDGVWYHDDLDTDILSAPRGVVVPSKVSEWEPRIITEEELPHEMDEDLV